MSHLHRGQSPFKVWLCLFQSQSETGLFYFYIVNSWPGGANAEFKLTHYPYLQNIAITVQNMHDTNTQKPEQVGDHAM